jgi:CRISPR-associated protein Cmr6
MPYTYLVPADTQRILQQKAEKCANMGLVLARYIPREVVFDEAIPNERNKTYRHEWLPATAQRFTLEKMTELPELIAATVTRWAEQTKQLGATRFELESVGRVIVGLGGKGALEIGITLHPVTGLPYIPGSALKGLCRNYALLTIAANINFQGDLNAFDEWLAMTNEKRTKELEKLGSKDDKLKFTQENLAKLEENSNLLRIFRDAFGSQDAAGVCIFFDAIVSDMETEQSLFTLDVMTPHFSEYYRTQGEKAPHDADSPNPIAFLTVTEWTVFAFAIGLRSGHRNDVDKELRKQVRQWLVYALRELGIGAKTAAGYGVFRPRQTNEG